MEIEEVLSYNCLEYHTIWQDANLQYDGEIATDYGQKIEPTKSHRLKGSGKITGNWYKKTFQSAKVNLPRKH